MNDRAEHRVLAASRRQRSRRLFIERFEDRMLLSTFTVNNTADHGPGTLRQAILDSNAKAAPVGQSNLIDFEIGKGVQTIEPTSELPPIMAPASIDTTVSTFGDSQVVEIRGDLAGQGAVGLTIDPPGSGSTIKGLVIDDFSGSGIVLSGGEDDLIESNLIGVDVSGELAMPNGGPGVSVEDSFDDMIGGSSLGSGNVISGNGGAGISISTRIPGSDLATTILGNDIGTDKTGSSSIPNHGSGVLIGDVQGNIIGGTGPGDGNLISGNAINGVEIDSSQATGVNAAGNVVQGNRIGTDGSGELALPNTGDGVLLSGASSSTIGGSASGASNLISGNLRDGIQVINAGGDSIDGNLIGSDQPGDVDLANVSNGIELDFASAVTIGGTIAADRNLIFGNGGSGISLYSSVANVIQGNLVGLNLLDALNSSVMNSDGSAHSLGNNQDGISMDSGSSANTVGGAAAGSGNIISGNLKNGISIINDSDGNVILGNDVGLDSTGHIARGNRLNGIYITTSGNTVGGTVAGSDNIISGNLNSGVALSTLTATGNTVEGNVIGLDSLGGDDPGGVSPKLGADGLLIGNRQEGIFINNSSNNQIGSLSPQGRNVISGNGDDGIQVFGSFSGVSQANEIGGNFIGTDASGLIAASNAADGVFIYNSAGNSVGEILGNVIGNLISANLGDGVGIVGVTATDNTILGNQIGIDGAGNPSQSLGNGGSGVSVQFGTGNQIGGPDSLGDRNVIEDNKASGVFIFSGAMNSTVMGNVVSANNGDGVLVGNNSDNSLVEGNLVGTDSTGIGGFGNAGDGVRVDNSGGVQVLSNVIASNDFAGVEFGGFSDMDTVQGNKIGTDASGEVPLGNAVGVEIDGVLGILVGGPSIGQGNLISGNGAGVQVSGANPATILGDLIEGNIIGLDASGTKALGNIVGVFLDDAIGVTIGGTTPGTRNLISGNTASGIQVFNVSYVLPNAGNLIEGNTIGLDVSGMAVPSGAVQPIGVFLNSSASNTVGGTTVGSGNLISGNTTGNANTPSYGISIFGQSVGLDPGNVVEGNLIGTNAAGGLLPLVNLSPVQTAGVVINSSAGNVIGGLTPSSRNGIEGNVVGVEVAGIVEGIADVEQMTGNVIAGDTIDANTFGVYLNGTQRNMVLDDDLSRNISIGLSIVGTQATGNTAMGDLIDANLEHGVYIEAADSNGTTPNLIANDQIDDNIQIGVYITRQAAGNEVRSNTIRDSKQYGIFLYNSASNLPAVARTGPLENSVSGSGIADFREYTGPPTKTSPATAGSKTSGTKAKSR